jgi:hypothetical protein
MGPFNILFGIGKLRELSFVLAPMTKSILD